MDTTHRLEAPHHSSADVQRRRRQLVIGATIAGAVILLVFPLQTILAAILAGSAWIITMALSVWMQKKVDAPDRNDVLRAMPLVAGGAVAVGIALTFVIPMTMVAVTLVLAVIAAGSMAFLASYERKTRIARRREVAAADTFEHSERRAA